MSTLVVMAAGLGSRYGSLKQVDGVGPSGATLLEYAVFDARRAGFTRIVFVIRAELAEALTALARGLPASLEVSAVVQDIDDLPSGYTRPAGRTRPWGTVHAVLAARGAVTSPFVAVNADDFYGPAAYRIAMDGCGEAARDGTATIVGLPLDATLSSHGPVVRGICETQGDWLTRIDEVYGIERSADGVRGHTRDRTPRAMTGAEITSMNMWVFPHTVFDLLAERFARFLDARGHDRDAELPLPEAVGGLVADRAILVRVRQAPGPWFGLTHLEDRRQLVESLRALIAGGEYPQSLWGRESAG